MKKTLSFSRLSSLLLCFSGSVVAVSGQAIPKAFGPGEELTYTASYSAAILSTDVATVVLKTTIDKIDDIPCYRISGRGQTKPFFSVFFKMDDTYTTWIDQGRMEPLLATADIKEGSYRYESKITFNRKAGLAYTYGKNLKKGYLRGGTRTVGETDFDPLGCFFHLRNTDLSKMKVGEREKINVVMIDTIETIEFKYLGKEIIAAPGIGEVRCLKFTCQLASGDSDAFQQGSSFLIWISDDGNKIPVYLETPVRVGSVYVTLTGWKNLANPFDAQLKKKE